MMKDLSRQHLGCAGEAVAQRYLKDRGYRILHKNYRNNLGEIDLIARDRDTLCFIEVKARRTHVCGVPEEAVSHRKQRQIIRLAMAYVQEQSLEADNVRFDVIAVDCGESNQYHVELIQNAFDAL